MNDETTDAANVPQTAAQTAALVPPRDPRLIARYREVYGIPDDVTVIDMDRVSAIVRAAGHPCYTEYTGGGCATIYGGAEYVDDLGDQRYPVLVGPGSFVRVTDVYPHAEPYRTHAFITTDECYIGRDDDGEYESLDARRVCATTDELVAALILAIIDAPRGELPDTDTLTAIGLDGTQQGIRP